MSAPGRPGHITGTAPDTAAANYTTLNFDTDKTVQRINIRNTEALGGNDLVFSLDGGRGGYLTLAPREAFWEANIRLQAIVVGGSGGTATYEITYVE
jgi:hypothetical protein